VPPILLSGDHKKIDAWRVAEGERLTRLRDGARGAEGSSSAPAARLVPGDPPARSSR
jgi:hypothetical protein